MAFDPHAFQGLYLPHAPKPDLACKCRLLVCRLADARLKRWFQFLNFYSYLLCRLADARLELVKRQEGQRVLEAARLQAEVSKLQAQLAAAATAAKT